MSSDSSTKRAFTIGVTETYTELFQSEFHLFGGRSEVNNKMMISIFKQNQIRNDIELFEFLEKNKNIKNTIFTSSSKMKRNYAIQHMALLALPKVESITLIDGEYIGYILNLNDRMREVSILKNGKRYIFSFLGFEIDDAYIESLLNTIVISEKK